MIKVDLPMPESCADCPLNYDYILCNAMDDEAWEKNRYDWGLQVCEGKHRPDYCPLIEVKQDDQD